MSESKRLTEIAAEMLRFAREYPWNPVGSPVPFQKQLGHGLRLTCYIHDGQITLDMERRHKDLEGGEAQITRLAFHAPRSAKSTSIPNHDGWRGVRLTWDAESETATTPANKQEALF